MQLPNCGNKQNNTKAFPNPKDIPIPADAGEGERSCTSEECCRKKDAHAIAQNPAVRYAGNHGGGEKEKQVDKARRLIIQMIDDGHPKQQQAPSTYTQPGQRPEYGTDEKC